MTYGKAHARIGSNAIEAIKRGTYPRTRRELHDGGGLHLRLNPTAPGGYWFYRYMRGGVHRKLGLGSLAFVGAADARERAGELRAKLRAGIDPQVQAKAELSAELRRAATLGQTFDEEAVLFIGEMKAAKQHERTVACFERWRSDRCRPVIGRMLIDDITTGHVAQIVTALMADGSHASGTKCGSFIKRVIAQAKGHGRADPNKANPADKALLAALVAHHKKGATRKHKAMRWQDVPGLCAQLAANSAPRAQALLVAILSGLRTAEVYRTRWDEFDMGARLWKKPLDHMKMKDGDDAEGHQVPISSGIAAVLDRLRPHHSGSGYVFEGQSKGTHIEETSMRKLLQKDMRIDATVHGFRSTISDWGLEHGYSRDVMDAVLAHKVPGVRGSYQRTTFLKQRVEVMEAWARYCLKPEGRRLKLAA